MVERIGIIINQASVGGHGVNRNKHNKRNNKRKLNRNDNNLNTPSVRGRPFHLNLDSKETMDGVEGRTLFTYIQLYIYTYIRTIHIFPFFLSFLSLSPLLYYTILLFIRYETMLG